MRLLIEHDEHVNAFYRAASIAMFGHDGWAGPAREIDEIGFALARYRREVALAKPYPWQTETEFDRSAR